MPYYALTIASPAPSAFIVTAHNHASATSQIRECLAIDYRGEDDPAVLASRVSLTSWASGQTVMETVLSELLAEVASGS